MRALTILLFFIAAGVTLPGCLEFNLDAYTFECKGDSDCSEGRTCQQHPSDPSLRVCTEGTGTTDDMTAADTTMPDTTTADTMMSDTTVPDTTPPTDTTPADIDEDIDTDTDTDTDIDIDTFSDTDTFTDTSFPDMSGGILTSCLDVVTQGVGTTDGQYTIDPDGEGTDFGDIQVYCDVTTEGGGWTRVFGLEVSGEPLPPTNTDIANGLLAALNGTGGIQPGELGVFAELIGWTELRFDCQKSGGTRINLSTSDITVTDYFTGATSTLPSSKTNVVILLDNTSTLAGEFPTWGTAGAGFWSDDTLALEQRLYTRPFFSSAAAWNADGSSMDCDDIGANPDGQWYVWVR